MRRPQLYLEDELWKLLHMLARQRASTETGDALIAATAATHDCALWTRNRKHYPMKDLTFY